MVRLDPSADEGSSSKPAACPAALLAAWCCPALQRRAVKQIDCVRACGVRRGMEPELHVLVRSAAAILEAAHVEPARRDDLTSHLVSHILRQQPNAMRHIVDLALSGRMREYEAREEIERATEPDCWRRAQGDPSAQAAHRLGTEGGCPRAPKMLQSSAHLGHRPVTTPWAVAARSAMPAQGAFQRVAPGGEESGDVRSGAELDEEAEYSEIGDVELHGDAVSRPRSDAGSPPGSYAESHPAQCSEFHPVPGQVEPNEETGEARQLCYVSVQIWRNHDAASKRQAEWTAKMRWMARFDPGVTHELYVGFRPSPRKARETMRRLAADGKASAAWAEEFLRITADLDPDTRVGLMSKRLFGADKAPGASSNARRFHDHCWAAMDLDAIRAPRRLLLDFGDGEPISFNRFTPATRRKANAPQWLALHDPDNLHGAKRDLAAVRRHLAQDRQVQAHSPATAVGELVAHYVGPVADKVDALIAENDSLRRQVGRLDQEAADMRGDIARLVAEVAELRRER